ncbi:uncharacterized protein DUF1192 [Humitalea rosea]|uniref:Uncharacterized protein DUF1192 n=1 Tax=Humitalea rosea TaxID=990373 RepID=A0A2W7J504_9PROT|nr:DUF1192 domain-containing protein [Humitalea rosea]PZW46756.1 uncharacterized protein DUF1192 [Humitalea rosea]
MQEEEGPRRRDAFQPRVLDAMGEEDLSAYIGELRGEIARAEAAIQARRAQKLAAAAFFRPG